MHGMGLYTKVDSYMVNMLYAWSFIHNTTLPIAIDKNNCFLSLNIYTTIFALGAGNLNENRTYQLRSFI